jgi:hypothetical protein
VLSGGCEVVNRKCPQRYLRIRICRLLSSVIGSGEVPGFDVLAEPRGSLVRGEIGGFKESAGGVLGADVGAHACQGVEGPCDIKGGVVPDDGALSGRVVDVGGLVEDFGGVGEDEEAVGEACRHPEKFEGLVFGWGFQVESGPFTEVGRAGAEVDGDVPDMAGEYPNQLALGLFELIVEAAEDAPGGEGLIVLNKLGR